MPSCIDCGWGIPPRNEWEERLGVDVKGPFRGTYYPNGDLNEQEFLFWEKSLIEWLDADPRANGGTHQIVGRCSISIRPKCGCDRQPQRGCNR